MEEIFEKDGDTILHQNLADDTVEYREYQVEMARKSLPLSSMVALPTGVGKTIVSLLVSAEMLRQEDGDRVLFVAPTKPLVEQQAASYRDLLSLSDEEVVVLTGDTSPDSREEIWSGDSRVIFATPQTVKNDMLESRVPTSSICHLVFDECHKATGDYAYVYIAEKYNAEREDALVTGLSASPGTEKEEILEVCGNIHVKNILVRNSNDPSLKKYLHETEISADFIDIDDEILEIRDALQDAFKDCLKYVKKNNYIDTAKKTTPHYKLREAQGKARKAINSRGNAQSAKKAISLISEAMNLKNAIQLVDSQGVSQVKEYLQTQKKEARKEDASWATERMVKREKVRKAYSLAESYSGTHPKKERLHTEIARTHMSGGRVIVFSEYRSTVREIVSYLTENLPDNVNIHKFVGQQDKKNGDGMTQKQQREVLDRFDNHEIDVLVSTSIGEEGLDIPQVQRVIFYEPVPSGIRTIQRRGRTGRQTSGEVTILVGKGTQDERNFYIAKNREDNMDKSLRQLQGMKDDLIEELVTRQQEKSDTEESTLDDKQPEKETTEKDSEQRDTTSHNDESRRDDDTGSTAEQTDDSPANRNLAEFMSGPENSPSEESSSENSGNISSKKKDEKFTGNTDTQTEPTEEKFETDKSTDFVIVDKRELRSEVVEQLDRSDNVEFETQMLDVGDYVVSQDCAIERKTASDLASTISEGDRDAFEQIKDLSNSYSKPILLLEGSLGELYSSNIPDVALRGILNSFILDFGIHIQFARNEQETAYHIENLASREQDDSQTTVQAHGSKETDTLRDQQIYTVSSISNIGTKTAERLLSELGSVKAVLTANKESLTEIDGIGEKTADKITTVSNSEFEDN